MKRICIDLDGVVAKLKRKDQSYIDCDLVPGAKEKIDSLKSNNHYIIIYTARHMKTCEGNTGLVMARVARQTLEWLDKHKIYYDEIIFGKPWADVYIDDNAYRFSGWENINEDGSNLPESHEKSKSS